MIKHLVMFSGGVCSWAAAKRVVERHGPEGVVLLFADTKMEDEDLYRFLDEGAANVGTPLVKIADGRTPWEVMRDTRFIANSRIDPCSRILKRELLNAWRDANCSPEETTVHFGLSWDEDSRVRDVIARMLPWKGSAPMSEKPWVSKDEMMEWLRREGIEPPRLYSMGFAHNNCGGFCVKAGQAHFARLLFHMPERYAWHEAQEEGMRKLVGDRAILKDRRGGTLKPLSLRAFRERLEADPKAFDKYDLGGCGCAVE